ncbi:hypothetical protein D918_09322 [Trichuris suis]|nr:hypothetical protein D918_09322 [Trichuris suis]
MFCNLVYSFSSPLLIPNPAAPFMHALPTSFPVSLFHPVGNSVAYHLNVNMSSSFSVISSSPSPTSSSASESQVSGIGLLLLLAADTGVLLRTSGSFVYAPGDALEFVIFNATTFCDQAVDDLTKVLRVGNVLKFQANRSRKVNFENSSYTDHIASLVTPITKDELQLVPVDTVDIMVKAIAILSRANCRPTDQLAHELSTINSAMELESINFILSLFREAKTTECHLNAIHCFVSNSRNHSLYNYVGTNSQKRRQFIENRRHIFFILPNDVVCLVPSSDYIGCLRLATVLKRYGGCMPLQELFDLYLCWPDLPLEVRELIGESKTSFIKFLEKHTPIFVIFPKRVFVSVRSRLAYFDYPSFLMETFGDKDGSSMLRFYADELCSGPLVNPVRTSSNFSHSVFVPTSMPVPVMVAKIGDNLNSGTFLTSVNSPLCALKAVSPYANVPYAAQHFYQPALGFGSTYVPNGGFSPFLNSQVACKVVKGTSSFPSRPGGRTNHGSPSGYAGSSRVSTDSISGGRATSPSLHPVHCGTQTDDIPLCPRCAEQSLFRQKRDIGVQATGLEECKDDSDEIWEDINKELSKVVFS